MKSYLVVGQGLAGIAIAEALLQARQEVTVVESGQLPSSTAIATGMYNPIVFRRLNKSWMVDALLPVMHAFYGNLQEKLQLELNQPISFYKRIPNEQYVEWWNERRNQEDFNTYLGEINNGFGEVFQAGIIDCAELKGAYTQHMTLQKRLHDTRFDYTKLEIKDDKAFYEDIAYDGIIFCEGPYAIENPYFDWLPFNICKGEWVVIQADRSVTDRVINNVVNIIPLGENRYKLSSTYAWDELNREPTLRAEQQLTRAFEALFTCNYSVIERAAGLRPTVSDRRPFLGTHPEHHMLHIFNGLGSKGVMLAPYFGMHLSDHLLYDRPLLPEVNIARHLNRFVSSAKAL